MSTWRLYTSSIGRVTREGKLLARSMTSSLLAHFDKPHLLITLHSWISEILFDFPFCCYTEKMPPLYPASDLRSAAGLYGGLKFHRGHNNWSIYGPPSFTQNLQFNLNLCDEITYELITGQDLEPKVKLLVSSQSDGNFWNDAKGRSQGWKQRIKTHFAWKFRLVTNHRTLPHHWTCGIRVELPLNFSYEPDLSGIPRATVETKTQNEWNPTFGSPIHSFRYITLHFEHMRMRREYCGLAWIYCPSYHLNVKIPLVCGLY